MKLSEEIIASETINDFGVIKRKYRYIGDVLLSDRIAALEQERDQLRKAVKQFVDEMDAQFPKLEMLPGEYDTLAELIGGNDEHRK